MRILIPILGFAPQGGYRVLSELANAWIRLGHDCTFLVPATSTEPYFPTTAKILRANRSGITAELGSARKQTGADNLLSLFRGLREVGSDYDVIFANHSLTAWAVRWSKAGKAKKFYYIQAYEPGYYPIRQHPIKYLMASVSYLFKLQQISNASIYRAPGLRPLEVIPPGIDLSIFIPKESPGTYKSGDEIVLGTIGRSETYKGTDTALAAYRLLRDEYPQLRMHVAFGNVTEAGDIKIIPVKGDIALAAYYRSIDLLVVACYGQHGAPHYPLIEAMASGTPVVHTGYFPGNVCNSWEATDSSVDSVAAAIRHAIKAPLKERVMKSGAARKLVSENLGWDATAQRFLSRFNA